MELIFWGILASLVVVGDRLDVATSLGEGVCLSCFEIADKHLSCLVVGCAAICHGTPDTMANNNGQLQVCSTEPYSGRCSWLEA